MLILSYLFLCCRRDTHELFAMPDDIQVSHGGIYQKIFKFMLKNDNTLFVLS